MTVRDRPDYESWRNNLRDFGAEYVVLGYSILDGLEKLVPYEQLWVKEYSSDFQEVFREGDVAVYKVL